jgi:hypothetical protein
MKHKAFKELLAAVRAVKLKRRQPFLRLVVSNPMPSIVNTVARIIAHPPECLELPQERTSASAALMSATDPKRT